MDYKYSHPFEKYFHFEKAKVDKGLLKMEDGDEYVIAKAFFDFNFAVDVDHNRIVEVVSLNQAKSVVLPKSLRNRTKIIYAGNDPVFASLDGHFNLITYLVLGSVVRVEYLGKLEEEKKVKYFKCW